MRDLSFGVAAAVVWLALIEDSGLGSAAVGALLGVALGRLFFGGATGVGRSRLSPRRLWAAVRLISRFGRELVVANFQQLRLVLAPRIDVRPHWILYRTALRSPGLRTLLGLLVSLTPGTVTADVLPGGLLVHLLDSDDPDAAAQRIRRRFESLLLELER